MSHASGKDDGFWRGRRVLITGCTGLVGAWTTRALVARGAHVVGLVRDRVAGSDLRRGGLIRKIDRVHGRLEDFQFLERVVNEHEIQTVFHLAAQAIVGTANRSPLATFEANIRGTYNRLEAARRSGLNPHVVLASSDKAYGVSKACADMLGRSYFESYGLPVCVTRCGNFFGGGDLNWNRLVPGAIRSLLAGEAPVLRSTGRELRDYFYVRDGAMAYIHLAERMAADETIHGRAFNFSANFRMNSLEMIGAICRQLGSRIEPRILGTATNEIPAQRVDSTLARERLGWAPRWTFDEALEETLAWYRAHLAGLESEASGVDEPEAATGRRLGRAA